MEILFKVTESEAKKLYNHIEIDMMTGLEIAFSDAFKQDLELEELSASTKGNQEQIYTGRLIAK